MKSRKFKAIILAGGSGERFWPLSTPARPKQFLKIFGGRSLIRQSVERLRGLVSPADTYVITSASLKSATRRELPELPDANIIGEPMRRDTAAAVALGVAAASADGVPATLAFFPADQLVAKPAKFRQALKTARRTAEREGAIVTLGIAPTYPATGYGYVDPCRRRFVEKPDARHAANYLRRGYLWNAGMFVATAAVFKSAIAERAPALQPLLELRPPRGISPRTLARIYRDLPRISFDYAVMEKIRNLAVVPGDFGWDDVGGYRAFEQHFPKDAAGMVTRGAVRSLGCAGCTAIASGAPVSLLGVRDLVVVSTPEAVLVVAKERLGELKQLVAK